MGHVTSPSLRTRTSQYGAHSSGHEVGSGPPNTTSFPALLHRVALAKRDRLCGSIAEKQTMSAHSRSLSLRDPQLRSTTRHSYSGGVIAAMVMSPRGGIGAFLPIKGRLCCIPQYVTGNSG